MKFKICIFTFIALSTFNLAFADYCQFAFGPPQVHKLPPSVIQKLGNYTIRDLLHHEHIIPNQLSEDQVRALGDRIIELTGTAYQLNALENRINVFTTEQLRALDDRINELTDMQLRALSVRINELTTQQLEALGNRIKKLTGKQIHALGDRIDELTAQQMHALGVRVFVGEKIKQLTDEQLIALGNEIKQLIGIQLRALGDRIIILTKEQLRALEKKISQLTKEQLRALGDRITELKGSQLKALGFRITELTGSQLQALDLTITKLTWQQLRALGVRIVELTYEQVILIAYHSYNKLTPQQQRLLQQDIPWTLDTYQMLQTTASLPIDIMSHEQQQAEALLGRPLTIAQADALERANIVGQGEIGKDGENFAGIGNYTKAHIWEKARTLRAEGFTSTEVRLLIEEGIL